MTDTGFKNDVCCSCGELINNPNSGESLDFVDRKDSCLSCGKQIEILDDRFDSYGTDFKFSFIDFAMLSFILIIIHVYILINATPGDDPV